MCLQCVTEAENFGTKENFEIVPGWCLMRATKDDPFEAWKKGQFGLVQINDPDVIFSIAPMKQPKREDFDSEEDFDKADEAFIDEAIELADRLVLDCMTGYTFVTAAIKVGFDPKTTHKEKTYDKNNLEFCLWFLDRIANWIEKYPEKSSDEWECEIRGITMDQWKKFCRETEEKWRNPKNERTK